MTPDEMIVKLIDPDFEDDSGLANQLLSQVYRGYPVENLKRLLTTPGGVGAFGFIVYELGQKARPLLREIAALLDNERVSARWEAIEALRACVTWQDAAEIAALISKIDDENSAVRLQAMSAIARLSYDNVRAGLDFMKSANPDGVFARLRNAFVAIELRREPERLARLLADADPVVRRFGAVLAMRPKLPDPKLAVVAVASHDPEVMEFVKSATEDADRHSAQGTGRG